jgi:hypothetical protein
MAKVRQVKTCINLVKTVFQTVFTKYKLSSSLYLPLSKIPLTCFKIATLKVGIEQTIHTLNEDKFAKLIPHLSISMV